MRELGINVEEAATMSAVAPVIAVLMPPLAGMIADKIGNFRVSAGLSRSEFPSYPNNNRQGFVVITVIARFHNWVYMDYATSSISTIGESGKLCCCTVGGFKRTVLC